MTMEKLHKIVGKSVIDRMLNLKMIMHSEKYRYNPNVLRKITYKYPLQAITIELTNVCNLNCVHCYGGFGKPSDKKQLSFDYIKSLKKDLDKLHTSQVRLSGGECFLHPYFKDIATFFLENGFYVCIYTNGYEVDKIIQFAEETKKYKYFLGISLDGIEEFHNIVRGNSKSFDRVTRTLGELKRYKNIDVLIATALMKQNISNYCEIDNFVRDNYPDYENQIFIASPVSGTDFSFGIDEFLEICEKHPKLKEPYFKRSSSLLNKKHRCKGGVSHGVITADGIMKICPIAVENEFVIGNVAEKTLYDVWTNPPENIEYYRNEYVRGMRKCRTCLSRFKCGDKNCRIEAFRFTGDYKNPDPYTCIAIKGKY